jgi:hypothetical protein
MASFKDKHGRQWHIDLTDGLIEKIHRETSFDLYDAMDSSAVDLTFGSPRRFAMILKVILAEQVKDKELTLDDFSAAFDGPTRQRAVLAFEESIIDFCHPSRIAAAMKAKLSEAITKIEDKAIARLPQALNEAFAKQSID